MFCNRAGMTYSSCWMRYCITMKSWWNISRNPQLWDILIMVKCLMISASMSYHYPGNESQLRSNLQRGYIPCSFCPNALRFYQRTFPVFPSDATPTSFGGKLNWFQKLPVPNICSRVLFPLFPALKPMSCHHISVRLEIGNLGKPGDNASCRCVFQGYWPICRAQVTLG